MNERRGFFAGPRHPRKPLCRGRSERQGKWHVGDLHLPLGTVTTRTWIALMRLAELLEREELR